MWKKIVVVVLAALVVVVSGILASLYFRRPAMAPPLTIRVEPSAERLARGKYLFEHVSSCEDCHSVVDETRFAFPVAPGGYAKGRVFPKEMGMPGRVVAPNLSSDPETGLGNWSDGEIIRAIREGIGKDGRALAPMMPYTELGHLSDEDVQSLVVHLRTIPPIRNSLPKTELDFPVNLLIKGVPKPVGTVPQPDPNDRMAYGKYLARVAGCQFCHTPVDDSGAPLEGRDFSGGHEFPLDEGIKVVSYNLTPHETGIGTWNEQQFVDKFYQYKEYAENGAPKVSLRDNTVMPWVRMAGMTRDDLAAIFAYLKTQQPIANAVETKPSASSDQKGK